MTVASSHGGRGERLIDIYLLTILLCPPHDAEEAGTTLGSILRMIPLCAPSTSVGLAILNLSSKSCDIEVAFANR